MRPEPGATPVSRLDLLPEDEAWWVHALRFWCHAAATREALAMEFATTYGPERGARVMSRLGEFMDIALGHARRPLLYHDPRCACVGADEAVFALFCSTATSGDRDEAMLMACLLFRADAAPIAVSLAQTLGLDRERAVRPAPSRVH